MNSLREEILLSLFNNTAGFNNKAASDIISIFEKRIDSMIEPYNNADDMLGQSILEKLLEVKEMIKAEMAPEHLK